MPKKSSIIILLVLCSYFLIFTFFPLHIALFEDPINRKIMKKLPNYLSLVW